MPVVGGIQDHYVYAVQAAHRLDRRAACIPAGPNLRLAPRDERGQRHGLVYVLYIDVDRTK
jgi:hypothetical protein